MSIKNVIAALLTAVFLSGCWGHHGGFHHFHDHHHGGGHFGHHHR